jgi:lysophospholipase L1-like esterase
VLQALALALTVATAACGGHSGPGPSPPSNPPTITCPGNITASATDGKAATVTFTTPSPSGGQAPVTVACTPGSGSSFNVGTGTVTCTATDAASRSGTCSFTVTVGAPPTLREVKFVAFGDSMTQGVTSIIAERLAYNPVDAYPLKLQSLLSARYTSQTIDVVNEGIAGEQADGKGKRRFASVLADDKPDVVLLLEGANDLNHYLIANGNSDDGITPAVRALQEMLDAAQKRDIPVLLATLPPQNPEGKNGHSARSVPKLNDKIRGLANSDKVVIVDLYNGLGGVPGSNIGSDGLHPTPDGYDRIAELWFDAIRNRYEQAPEGGGTLRLTLTRQ